MLPIGSLAQNINSVSPYSQYGYGQLADPSFGSQRAMGGIGYGLRKPEMINPLNPASYSAVDSMSFMLDLALKAQYASLQQGTDQSGRYSGGLEYLALQFPLAKNLGMGIGLAPVSQVGYKFKTTLNFQELEGSADTYFVGKGGFNKVYATLSYDFFDKLSLGVNVGYLFGDLIREKYTLPVSTGLRLNWNDTIRAAGLLYEIGAQYRMPLNDSQEEIIFGVVYSPKTKVPIKTMEGFISYQGNSVVQDINSISTSRTFQMPETYSVGISYSKINKLTVGADFQYQRWEDAKFFNIIDSLSDRMKINVGVEYIPDYMESNVFKKMRYRAGAYYTNSYIQVGNQYGYQDYGFTLGFGIPLVDRRSMINMAFEYNIISPDKRPDGLMIDERYFRFTFSYTFNELWFFKRKLQ